MTPGRRLIGVAALLLAAAFGSILMATRPPEPFARRPQGAPGVAPAGEPAAGAVGDAARLPEADPRLQEQLAVLREGLAARGVASGAPSAPPRGSASSLRAVIVAGLSGLSLGLGVALLCAIRFRRASRRSTAADAPGAGASRLEAGPHRAPDLDPPLREASLASPGVFPAAGGGLAPWSREARPSRGRSELNRRLRSVERTLLLLNQRLDALADEAAARAGSERPGGAPAEPEGDEPSSAPRRDGELRGEVRPEPDLADGDPDEVPAEPPPVDSASLGDSARLVGFARALVQANGAGAAADDPTAGRVRQAIRRLSREGWSDARIARRLWLDADSVSRVLQEAERATPPRRAKMKGAL